MIYLHYFEDASAFTEAYNGEEYKEPWTSYTVENEKVDYNKPKEYDKEYLTFNMLESGDVSWLTTDEDNDAYRTIQYSLNGGEWSAITSSYSEPPFISVNEGDVLRFKGENTEGYCTENSYQTKFSSDAAFNIEGNIMSLLYGDNFKGQTVLPASPGGGEEGSTFGQIFGGCPVVNASNLILPATGLSDNCYGGMFYNCTSLTLAPALPATTLANYCYQNMFRGCTSLTQAPELPATTLAIYCYSDMFNGCTGLTKAPELPIGILVEGCYSGMFRGCTNLNYIKCLATNISAEQCTYEWVGQVAANGTFVADPNTQWASGVDGIPEGWTRQ